MSSIFVPLAVRRWLPCLFLLLLLTGPFAEIGVRQRLIVWHDPEATLTLLREHRSLFGLGIGAFLVMVLADLPIAVLLLDWLRKGDVALAVLMAGARAGYALVKVVALSGLLIVYQGLHLQPDNQATPPERVMDWLAFHDLGFSLGLVLFGGHLLALALLVGRYTAVPRWISWLLGIAGAGYALNSLLHIFFPYAGAWQAGVFAVFGLPMTFAELGLAWWIWRRRP